MEKLKIGDKAPDFLIKTADNTEFSISNLQDKYIVLYFYPKDDTPGCTTEAIDFNQLLNEFEKLNTIVLGVSKDDLNSHNKFKNKYNLKLELGSDIEGQACSRYSVLSEKSMFGKKYIGINRMTFLIDPKGIIAYIWPKVTVAGHAQDVLAKVKELSNRN